MNRDALLVALAGYAAEGTQEAESLARIRRFVAAPAIRFRRDNPEGHVTGSAVVARPDGSAFLLVLPPQALALAPAGRTHRGGGRVRLRHRAARGARGDRHRATSTRRWARRDPRRGRPRDPGARQGRRALALRPALPAHRCGVDPPRRGSDPPMRWASSTRPIALGMTLARGACGRRPAWIRRAIARALEKTRVTGDGRARPRDRTADARLVDSPRTTEDEVDQRRRR